MLLRKVTTLVCAHLSASRIPASQFAAKLAVCIKFVIVNTLDCCLRCLRSHESGETDVRSFLGRHPGVMVSRQGPQQIVDFTLMQVLREPPDNDRANRSRRHCNGTERDNLLLQYER